MGNKAKRNYLALRLDEKLFKQLASYADRNDGGRVSVSARRALEQFLRESENKKE